MYGTDTEMILAVTQAQLAATEDAEVTLSLQRVMVRDGDLLSALNDLASAPPEFYGPGSRFLEALVDRTFEALLGKEELVEKLEAHRRSIIGNAVAGGITAAASLISGASGLQVAAAVIVFLYLVPIGVRAAFDAWRSRQAF